MKHFSVLSLCLVLFAAATLCKSQHPASAQTTTRPPLVTQTIKMHDVRSDIMAYWIDPANQPVPPEYRNFSFSPLLPTDEINQYIPQIRVFEKSFQGQLLAAINAQNALMISGSQDNLDQDKKLIQSMDKPIVQMEVVTLTLTGAQKILNTIPTLPLHLLNAKPKDPAYSIALMTADADELVKQLQTSGKIKTVISPRRTTIDNFPAPLGWSNTTPVELEIKQTPGTYLPFNSIGDNKIGLETAPNVRVIPTTNADGTVTISLTLSYDASLVDYQAISRKPFSKIRPQRIFIKSLNNGPITFNFTVKDNQSVLVRGIDSLYKLGDYNPPPMIFILTVHVQHRAEG